MVQVSVTNFHFVKPGLIVEWGFSHISSQRSRHSSWPLNVGSQDLKRNCEKQHRADFNNRTETSFEDARARGIVCTRVYFDYIWQS